MHNINFLVENPADKNNSNALLIQEPIKLHKNILLN